MSFFKDFKEDFTQAMNELMPDGNEMYEEDEIMEETLEEPEKKVVVKSAPVKEEAPVKESTVKEKPVKEKTVKEKKTVRSKKEVKKEETENRKVKMSRPPKEVPLKTRVMEEEHEEDELDIAPEDMSEQIDDLLDRELYSDEAEPAVLLDDDTEVNTMDMSVEELLNQLSEKKGTAREEAVPDVSVTVLPEAEPEEEEIIEEPEELSIDDLLRQLDNTVPVHSEEPSVIKEEEPEEISPTSNEDLELEALLNSIAAKNNVAEVRTEQPQDEPEEEELIEEPEEAVEEPEEIVEEPEETVEEMEVQEPVIEDDGEPEAIAEEINEQEAIMEDVETPQDIIEDNLEYIPEEAEAPEIITEADEEPEYDIETEEDEAEEWEEEPEEESENITSAQMEEEPVAEEVKIEIKEALEENKMSAEKDVISINQVEEKPEAVKEEPVYNSEDADTETTYITKGSKLTGNLETDGSIDIIGTIEGNVDCKGKIVVGGKVVGNIVAGELYANNARIEGDVKSYGSIKVGVGSMIIGGIEGESAVIAGAVNGDIDVKGPVIVDSTAVIMGNIKSRSVQINNGAVIEGFCSQSYSDIDVKSFFA